MDCPIDRCFTAGVSEVGSDNAQPRSLLKLRGCKSMDVIKYAE